MPSPTESSHCPHNLFVYGTLKRNEERAHMWPKAPLEVKPAYVQGELYDLGAYPALLPPCEGSVGDRIAGEVWMFDHSSIAETLRALDRIEVYNQPGEPNLYLRTITVAHQSSGDESLEVQTYVYADPLRLRSGAKRIGPDATGWCNWSGQ